MRPDLAEGTDRPRARALVLGPRCVAESLAKRFEEEGYAASVSAERLPLPSDPNALSKLRELLGAFAHECGPPRGYAHCVHPGVSVWADRPEISIVGQEFGLNVIAPPARVLSLFANKLTLMAEAERLGIPHLVLDFNPIHSPRELDSVLAHYPRRFPVVLKSVRGGGSEGVLVLHQVEDLERKLPLWLEQLRRNQGEVMLLAERYIEGARHIVVPFARFHDGRFHAFPMTDASLQLRCRKIVEFCPAAEIAPAMERQLAEWTARLAEQSGYTGVGALEFLVDGTRAFLVEGLPRLAADFELWERVAGTNAVSWQLSAIENRHPEPKCRPVREWSAGVCLRLYAEDPLLQLPQPGVVHELSEQREWRFPGSSAELRLPLQGGEDLYESGNGLLGLLLVGSSERLQAMTIARGVLEELWISGSLQTNERFLFELLLHPWVREGIFHAGFVDEEFIPELRPSPELMQIFATVCSTLQTGKGSSDRSRWAVGDQWVKLDPGQLNWVGEPRVWQRAEDAFGISGMVQLADGRKLRVCAYPVSAGRWQVRIGNWFMPVRHVLADPSRVARVAGKPVQHRLMALVSGRVHSMLYRVDSVVPAHDPLVIVESLRVLVPHALPADARVLEWKVVPEQFVQAGQELAVFQIPPSASGLPN
jgi:acetyl/propionyl-CoA carboxylase alpha subunit